FAAFMSTITTTLNLSASYLVNDLWLPLVGGGRAGDGEHGTSADRGRVVVARLAVAVVAIVGSIVSWQLVSAGEGWTVIMDMTAGVGPVLILRWLWWRVNAWSEISAMLASAAAYTVVRGLDLDARLAEAIGGPAEQIG